MKNNSINFVVRTINGTFMSETFTMNGLDFETLYIDDAKKFSSREEAENYIHNNGFDTNFCYVAEVEEEADVDDESRDGLFR